jgi:hypothetical protein
VTLHGCTIRSPLTGCQVTSRPRDRFSRYSKWLDTFRTALVLMSTLHGRSPIAHSLHILLMSLASNSDCLPHIRPTSRNESANWRLAIVCGRPGWLLPNRQTLSRKPCLAQVLRYHTRPTVKVQLAYSHRLLYVSPCNNQRTHFQVMSKANNVNEYI